jgi:hypothetical protein
MSHVGLNWNIVEGKDWKSVKSDESGKAGKERVYFTIVNVKVFLIK